MATSYTSLLGLALPVQGELSGTWGNEVNNYITEYLDASVAGTQIISGSLTAVTLSKTTNASLAQAGSGATGSSQYQIIRCSGNPASLLTITAPAASKVYLIINATSTAQSVKIVGVGPTAGVTIATGKGALVAWNGSDFVTVASNDASVITGVLAVANGGTGLATLTANNVILGNGTSTPLFVAPSTAGNVLTSNGTTWTSAAVAAGLSGVTQSASPFETALGYQAGNVTTGVNNTWVGYQAGLLTTSGTGNTAIGFQTLDANTTGANNVAVGINALGANIDGERNVALGSNALLINNSGNYNTALGASALAANTNGSNNVAVGREALFANTTGEQNTAVGRASLQSNTTASNNTSVGYTSLYSNTTGANNVAMGNGALYANTTGSGNVAIGNDALDANTTATNNTAVGYTAGTANTTGSITAVGYGALRSNTTGASNTGVGLVALGSTTTGNNNSALGEYSLYQNTTGAENTAVGYNALGTNTIGANHVAVGRQALYSMTTGTSSTAVGDAALYSATGDENTALGKNAGFGVTTGTSNTLIGRGAGFSGTNDLTTGSNNIIIGRNAAASSATVSNEVTIGATTIVSTRLRGMVELNAAMLEAATISATAATGTINYDARTQSVLYYTSNASGNWTLNIRAASGVSLDSVMTTGESMTVAFLVTNGATAYYQTGFQVDGSAVTPKWQGGTAPAAGNASSIDTYVITVIKTGSATFTVLASQTKFA